MSAFQIGCIILLACFAVFSICCIVWIGIEGIKYDLKHPRIFWSPEDDLCPEELNEITKERQNDSTEAPKMTVWIIWINSQKIQDE